MSHAPTDPPATPSTDGPVPTKDVLAFELRKVGLSEMADRAATGYYHDFLSPLDLPELTLVSHLEEAAKSLPDDHAKRVMALRARVIDGEFDASQEESDAWARSPEGQEAFGKLIRGE